MKHEKFLTVLAAGALAFCTAWGAAGCLISAFDLPLAHPRALLLVCGGGALLSAGLLVFRRGGLALLCLLALACGYIYHDGTAFRQLWQLCYHFSEFYDRAYGCGVLILPEALEGPAVFDWPLWMLVTLISAAVSRCVCRRTSVWLPMLTTIGPLCACIVVTDTVPGEIWLMTVLAGLLLLLLTSTVRRENSAQGLRLLAASVLPVTLGLLTLFLAVPQQGYVNHAETFRENIITAARHAPQILDLGLRQLTATIQGQPRNQVDLSSLGPRIPFSYPVMEVTAERSGPLYLRDQDFDRYDGRGWAATEDRQEEFYLESETPEIITVSTRNRKELRFLTYHPANPTQLLAGRQENREGDTVYPLLRSDLPTNWREEAYRHSSGVPEEWQDFTDLPEITRQEAQLLLSGLYDPAASNTEKAEKIAAYVTNSAVYDLEPSVMPPGEPDFALWFLRSGERGYCVHFATAAAVLLRAADIPARYVTGYLVEAEAGRPVTVTEEDAHAWAEYYEPALNLWLPLDATPVSQTQPPETRPAPAQPLPAEPAETTIAVTEPVTEPTEATASTAPPEPELPMETQPTPEEPVSVPVVPLLAVSLLILALPAQRVLRLAVRRRLLRTGSPNQRALRRWQEAGRLSRLLKECPPEELLALAQKAKFSQHELTAEELLQFDSFNRVCLRRLGEKPWYFKLICQYIYAVF